MARVRCHRLAVKIVDRHQHLTARWFGALQRAKRAGDGPGPPVPIALIPDQAGVVHVFTTNIQTKDGNRQMPPALVKRQQLMPPDDLATANAVGVGQHDIEGVDIGVRGQKSLGFGNGRT